MPSNKYEYDGINPYVFMASTDMMPVDPDVINLILTTHKHNMNKPDEFIHIGCFVNSSKTVHPITMPKYSTCLNCLDFVPLLKCRGATLTIDDRIYNTNLLKLHGVSLSIPFIPPKIYELTVVAIDLIRFHKYIDKYDDLRKINVIFYNDGIYEHYFGDYNRIRLQYIYIQFKTIITSNIQTVNEAIKE